MTDEKSKQYNLIFSMDNEVLIAGNWFSDKSPEEALGYFLSLYLNRRLKHD